jgi:hypothetical protein
MLARYLGITLRGRRKDFLSLGRDVGKWASSVYPFVTVSMRYPS